LPIKIDSYTRRSEEDLSEAVATLCISGPQDAVFTKLEPGETDLFKPLYIKGHLDGKPITS